MHFSLHAWPIRWAIFLGSWIVISLILGLFKRLAIRIVEPLVKKTNTDLDDRAIRVLRTINPIVLWAVGLAFANPLFPLHAGHVVKDIVVIALGLQLLISGSQMAGPLAAHFIFRNATEDDNQTAKNALDIIVKVIVWVAITLLILENLGIKISTLIAGLGVGGIAAGLALQNVASDLFASLSIMLDKPFDVGDFIVINAFSGNVERIGIKSTRIRSLSGEELILPNSDLTVGSIHNYKHMQERRILFTIGVVYQTRLEHLKEIPELLQRIIEAQSNARFDRAHFQGFGPSSLDFQIVYYTLSPDYTMFMDTQQAINLEIFEAFSAHGIDFAFPTQTIIMDNPNAASSGSKLPTVDGVGPEPPSSQPEGGPS